METHIQQRHSNKQMTEYFITVAIFLLFSCKADTTKAHSIQVDSVNISEGRIFLGREVAVQQMKEALKFHTKPFAKDSLIKDSATAVAIAEPILFNTYGKEQILSERPYEVYLIDSLWYLMGTIPEGHKGGGFEIIINSRDARVMSLRHYK